MVHVALPVEDLLEGNGSRAEPHKRLMLAVLKAVVDDCQEYERPSRYRARVKNHTYQQAAAYVASTDRSWPFSFENLCESIGLDVASTRAALAADPSPLGDEEDGSS
jgi:hypothetical protein